MNPAPVIAWCDYLRKQGAAVPYTYVAILVVNAIDEGMRIKRGISLHDADLDRLLAAEPHERFELGQPRGPS